MRHNDANKIVPPTPCHMCHSQIFYKIDSFLKPSLNIFYLRNIVARWGSWLLRRRLVFCMKLIDLEDVLLVRGSRLHHNNNWYYLGPFQTSKVKLFGKIAFGYKPITFLVKSFNTLMFDWFYKAIPINTFYVLLVKILHPERKHVISSPVGLSLLFQEKLWLSKREGVGLINGNGANGLQFFLRITITSLKNCLSTFNFFPVTFSRLLLWIPTENTTKLKT